MSVLIRDQMLGALSPIMRYSTRGRARILMYHRFDEVGDNRRLSANAFEEQIRYLKKHYRIVSLSSLVAAVSQGERVDEKTVVITVDDGYADFARCAYPILRRHGVPATLYVVTRFVDQEIWLWFDVLHFMMSSCKRGTYRVKVLGKIFSAQLDDTYSRGFFWEKLADALVPQTSETKDRELAQLSRQMKMDIPKLPTNQYQALTWSDVVEMDPELIEIGAHTVSHPILSTCSIDQQRFEIAESKLRIEQMTNRKATHFCYPNGQIGDYSSDTIDLVKELGFESAVLAHGGFLGKQPNLFMLERMGAPFEQRDFAKCIDGVWHLRERLSRSAR